MYRIGFGSDIHRLVPGRKLILGGIEIASDIGAKGHSDADALTHSITDALLGALALGDIGTHFPSSDERWRNSESFVFLRFALGLIKERGYAVVNVDSTIHLESPKLLPDVEKMRDGIAEALEVETHAVSIKAKTGEAVDAVGERRAVRAEAIVLLASTE